MRLDWISEVCLSIRIEAASIGLPYNVSPKLEVLPVPHRSSSCQDIQIRADDVEDEGELCSPYLKETLWPQYNPICYRFELS